MKTVLGTVFLFFVGCYNKVTKTNPPVATESERVQLNSQILEYPLKTISGKDAKLKDYNGKVFLVVNTASKCGFTPQYKGLEKLYKDHKDKGLVILGFPSNDFGAQEPGTAEDIKTFCEINYGVTFPLFEKGPVKGDGIQGFYKTLIAASSDTSEVQWNFEKFLLNSKGEVVKRFRSTAKPESLEPDILALLK